MTKPLIAVITDKPTPQSRMFFWVKEAVAEEQPIVFTTPLERTTISPHTTKVVSELGNKPLELNSADYQAMQVKGETDSGFEANSIADLFDATDKKVIEAAISKIDAFKDLSKTIKHSNIQTAAEALAGIDGYMVAGGFQCGPSSYATCWIRYNFGKIGESSFRSANKLEEIEITNTDNSNSSNKAKKIKDGVPAENKDDGNVDTTYFSYVPHSDGTVTVSNFMFGEAIDSKEPPISFNVLTVETVKLQGETFKANPKYIGKHSKEVTFSSNNNSAVYEMYIVKIHSPEERFDWSDEAVRAGQKRTIKITNGDGKEETKTEECKKDIRCEDGTFTSGKDADPQIFPGQKFEIVMRTSGDYYAIAKNDPTEEFYYSGNMGPFAKKRDYRRGRYEKTGSDEKGYTYTFYGEGGVPVFKIVDCSKGENTSITTVATTASTENASNSGDNNMSCSSGHRAAGHIALANYDSFVFFNRDAAETIQKAWEKTETTSQK